MEYIEKPNLFFVYDAKAELQKRICSGQFTIVDNDFATLGFKCGVDYVMDIINKAEVKDVKPVIHAHWVEEHRNYMVCSNCGKYRGDWRTESFVYCPYCGAKMDEEVNDGQMC